MKKSNWNFNQSTPKLQVFKPQKGPSFLVIHFLWTGSSRAVVPTHLGYTASKMNGNQKPTGILSVKSANQDPRGHQLTNSLL